MFEKLHKFLGKNLKNLVEQKDEDYVFRLHKNRIYYVKESLLRRATNVSIAKYTHTLKKLSRNRIMQLLQSVHALQYKRQLEFKRAFSISRYSFAMKGESFTGCWRETGASGLSCWENHSQWEI